MAVALEDLVTKLDTADNLKIDSSNGSVTGPLSVNSTIKFTKQGAFIKGSSASNGAHVYAGENNFDGASLQLFNKDNSQYAGSFYLRASTKSSSSDTSGKAYTLVGYPSGSLTWNGGEVWTSNGGKLSANAALDITSGKITSTAGNVIVYTNKSASNADTTRSAASYCMLTVANDNAGKRAGGTEVSWGTDGSRSISFTMRNRDDTGYLSMGLKEFADGSSYGYSVTPPAGSNTNAIATTQWCHGHGILVASSKSSTSFYRKYSDGWIEQGGKLTVTTSATITFPIAFATSCIACMSHPVIQPTNSTSDTNYITKVKALSNTSFQLHYRDSDSTATRTGTCSWYACGY